MSIEDTRHREEGRNMRWLMSRKILMMRAGVLLVLGLVASNMDAQTFTTLASFNGGSNGIGPFAGVTLGGSTLYGTTGYGGANSEGVVFSLPLSGGSPTVLASFNGTNGGYTQSGLTLVGNTLYGTTDCWRRLWGRRGLQPSH